eukprot:TRINITY_DN11906_c0_g1_i2.p2 TRINITY_DN11906_c0_g1~~TRINITY_DN11906_c0_g1_i2.p2  ORF type:complete len:182 (+),score=20.54 TRINITY_DN11906_c0_g1_i2:62-547(+)
MAVHPVLLLGCIVWCVLAQESCVLDADCSGASQKQICVDGRCIRPLSSGEHCSISAECASSRLLELGAAACREGTCVAAAMGASCLPLSRYDAQTCGRSLYCKADQDDGGTCRSVKQQATPCTLVDVIDGACGAAFTCNIISTDMGMPAVGQSTENCSCVV